jgi:hypothetical protein
MEGPFGSVQFMCEGNSWEEVSDIVTSFSASGECSGNATKNTRNLKLVRLGVSCPINTTRQYVYDDTYFECFGVDADTSDRAMDPFDLYTCVGKPACSGAGCVLSFEPIYVDSVVSRFVDNGCVDAIVPITEFPTSAPIPISNDDETVSAQFEASWGSLFSSDVASSDCTMGGKAFVILSCENGASIDPMPVHDCTVFCNPLSNDRIQCIVDEGNIVNRFETVIFVSFFLHETHLSEAYTHTFSFCCSI